MPFEPLDQYEQRKENLEEIVRLGEEAYPHRFDFTHTTRSATVLRRPTR